MVARNEIVPSGDLSKNQLQLLRGNILHYQGLYGFFLLFVLSVSLKAMQSSFERLFCRLQQKQLVLLPN